MTHASRYIIIIVTIVIVPDSDKVYAISMYLYSPQNNAQKHKSPRFSVSIYGQLRQP